MLDPQVEESVVGLRTLQQWENFFDESAALNMPVNLENAAVACCRGREPPELTQDWGNRLLEGTIKTLCAPGPRRKEQTPQEAGFTIPE